MKKNTTKLQILCAFLSLILLFPTLASCGNKNKNEDTHVDTGQTEPEVDLTTITDFNFEILSQMKIVYPHGASETVASEADKLQKSIQSVFGVELLVASDYLREGSEIYSEIPNEILIGNTNRDEDDAFYTSIGYEDYGYTAVGGKIVIGGGNDYAIAKAVTDFVYNIVMLKKGGEDLFFSSAYALDFKYSYTISELKLNGAPIQQYQIVYPEKGTQFEEQLAIYLASNVQKLTGYRIPTVSDATAYADGYEILIGRTNRSSAQALYTTAVDGMNGCIAGAGKWIALYGSSTQGNVTAANALIERIKNGTAGTNKKVDLSFSTGELVEKSSKLSTMTYNLQTYDMTKDRSSQVLEMLMRYLPDVLGVQEANATWINLLNNNFSEYYEIVGEGRDGGTVGERSSILYAKERFELIDTGTKWLTDTPDEVSKISGSTYFRIMTYALLKDRVSGETTLFVNTHLDYTIAKETQVKILFNLIRELGYEDYPVVVTGDMNAPLQAPTLQYMVSLGLSSVNTVADYTEGIPDIDFVMVTDDCIDVSFARVCDETILGVIPSDHPATYAEFTVTIPEGGVDHDFREPLPNPPDGWLDFEWDENDEYGDINRVQHLDTPSVPDHAPNDPPEQTPEDPPETEDGYLDIEQDSAGTDFNDLIFVH